MELAYQLARGEDCVQIEPLLLLLLGSTLISISQAIKLIVSKGVNSKPVRTAGRNRA